MFKNNEHQACGFRVPLSSALDNLCYNDAGLVPVIARQHNSGEILMMAWMNRAAIEETLSSGQVCYYSRSRKALWRKGEQSGQTQKLISMHIDCDGDALLVNVDQTGPACHTGRRDCFFWRVEGDHAEIDKRPLIAPDQLYSKS